MTTETTTMRIPETLRKLAVPIDSLVPYNRNPRESDVGQIVLSLRRNGQYRAVVARKADNTILCGNHTWIAAKQEGWTHIAATFMDVDDEAARRIMLADNRISDLGSYDEAVLADILREIAELEGPDGLVGTGYDGDDLDELIGKMEQGDQPIEDGLQARFGVVLEVETEEEQARAIEALVGMGFEPRALYA